MADRIGTMDLQGGFTALALVSVGSRRVRRLRCAAVVKELAAPVQRLAPLLASTMATWPDAAACLYPRELDPMVVADDVRCCSNTHTTKRLTYSRRPGSPATGRNGSRSTRSSSAEAAQRGVFPDPEIDAIARYRHASVATCSEEDAGDATRALSSLTWTLALRPTPRPVPPRRRDRPALTARGVALKASAIRAHCASCSEGSRSMTRMHQAVLR